MVASIIMYSLSASLANSWKIRSKTPLFAQRPLMHALPIAEARGQIAPRNTGSEPVQNGFNEQPVTRRRASDVAFATRQNILDPIPLVVAQAKALHLSALLKPTSQESD